MRLSLFINHYFIMIFSFRLIIVYRFMDETFFQRNLTRTENMAARISDVKFFDGPFGGQYLISRDYMNMKVKF